MVYPTAFEVMLACEETNETTYRSGVTVPVGVSAPVFRLTRGLPAEGVRDALRRANRMTDSGLRTLAFYLAEMSQRGLHQLLGFASAVQFAVARLDMSRRQARDLIAAGVALAGLPRADAAFRENRI